MKNVKKIATEILAGMQVLDPTRQQSRTILRALRDYYGIEIVEDPIWREYITFRAEPSNKFHYFVVFKVSDDSGDKYVAANAYGRIGYTPKVVDLGEYPTKQDALNRAKSKLRTKIQKGYVITELA